jgi:hypothetical protein
MASMNRPGLRLSSVLLLAALVAPSGTEAQAPKRPDPPPQGRARKLEPPQKNSSILSREQRVTPPDKGPTLDETLVWLQGQFAAHGGYTFCQPLTGTAWAGHTYATSVETYDGCVLGLRIQDHGTFEDGGARPQTRVYECAIPLGDLNATDITIRQVQGCGPEWQQFVVTLATYTGAKTIRVRYTATTKTDTGVETVADERQTWNVVSFGFETREIAERVAKGISHAIKLCGGKESPF